MNADLTKRLQYKIDNPKSWGGSFNERTFYIELLSELRSSEAREAALRERVAKPIGMQDVRLVAGEGKLPGHVILQAVNVIIAQRAKDQA